MEPQGSMKQIKGSAENSMKIEAYWLIKSIVHIYCAVRNQTILTVIKRPIPSEAKVQWGVACQLSVQNERDIFHLNSGLYLDIAAFRSNVGPL